MYILGKPGLNQNSASKHCEIHMHTLSLMTSNFFLGGYISATVLTAFTTPKGRLQCRKLYRLLRNLWEKEKQNYIQVVLNYTFLPADSLQATEVTVTSLI